MITRPDNSKLITEIWKAETIGFTFQRRLDYIVEQRSDRT